MDSDALFCLLQSGHDSNAWRMHGLISPVGKELHSRYKCLSQVRLPNVNIAEDLAGVPQFFLSPTERGAAAG